MTFLPSEGVEIGRVKKNGNTDIVVKIDDFAGKIGITIREYVNDEATGYRGFNKSGTRVSAEQFEAFRKIIDAVNLEGIVPRESEIIKAKEFTEAYNKTHKNKPI